MYQPELQTSIADRPLLAYDQKQHGLMFLKVISYLLMDEQYSFGTSEESQRRSYLAKLKELARYETERSYFGQYRDLLWNSIAAMRPAEEDDEADDDKLEYTGFRTYGNGEVACAVVCAYCAGSRPNGSTHTKLPNLLEVACGIT